MRILPLWEEETAFISLSQTPALLQRRNRLYAVVCGPYRSGKSRHGAPDRSTQKIPFKTRRSSTRGMPRGLFGSKGSMARHSKSDKSYRLILRVNHYLLNEETLATRYEVSKARDAMSDSYITVLAEIQLNPTSEGGRTAPVSGSYRPNHNFFGPDNRDMTVGFIDIPQGSELRPGDSTRLPIRFWRWPGIEGEIFPGREWSIQEGAKVVGSGKVLQVLKTHL